MNVLWRCSFIIGATKIVPIEAAPAEAVIQPDATVGESTQKKGYQEYAIQQAAYEAPLKSNRYKVDPKQGCLGLLGSRTE